MRSAIFDLYRRHRAAEGADTCSWQSCWDRSEYERIRAIGVDFDTRHVFLVLDVVIGSGTLHRLTLTPDDLARGADQTALVLRDHLRGEELEIAQNWIFRHWHTMTRYALVAVGSSTVALYARIGSPVAEFARLPPDVFAHYKITDWLKGVAESPHGPPLLSPHLDLECAGPYLGEPSLSGPDYVEERRAATAKRPRPVLDFAIGFIGESFPNGTPPGMTHKMIAREVSEAHYRQFGRRRDISGETIRKALAERRCNDRQ